MDAIKDLLARLGQALKPLVEAVDLRLVAMLAVFAFFGAVGVVIGTWKNVCATCPSVAQIRTFETEQTSKLLS